MNTWIYWFFIICGLLAIVQGLYWIVVKKARGHWWTGLEKVNKKDNPEKYWLYVLLSLIIGVVAVLGGIVLLIFH